MALSAAEVLSGLAEIVNDETGIANDAVQLDKSFTLLQKDFPGISWSQEGKFVQVNLPAELELKRDITFKVFSDYLLNHSLPKWEVPNTIAKYFITTTALEMAKAKD